PAAYGPEQGYPAEPGYGGPQPPAPRWAPAAPPRRRRPTGLILLLAALAALVLGGVGAGVYLVNRDKPGTATGTPGPSGQPAGGPATGQPTADPGPTGAAPTSSADARFAAKGQCLLNKGDNAKPVMEITGCAPGAYEVLARFDGTKDYAGRCGAGKVPGYQYYYFFDSDLDTLDFVLCLKRRPGGR
ncbi:MAG TPA: flagellar basal body protein FliL, partial [Pilimelia sp.]|nr:flagellar basal body protein FliL [Pilimelia sp.]